MTKRIVMLVIGVLLLVLGLTICNRTGFGIDPFTAFCISISRFFGFSPGQMIFAVNLIILTIIFFARRHLIGLASLVVALFFGFIFDFYARYIPAGYFVSDQLGIQLLYFLLGILVATFGVALYIESNFGFAPYDGVPFIFAKSESSPSAAYRMTLDGTIALLAFIFRGPIGIGTVVLALFVGPLIDFYRKNVRRILGIEERTATTP